MLHTAGLLMSGVRDVALFAQRAKSDQRTIYCSERWFKPKLGALRLLQPSYWKMARKFVCQLREDDSLFYYPMGIHAARDMARICGLMNGDLGCLFCAPELDFEHKPGGRIWLRNGGDVTKYCLDKMRIWGYFVEASITKSISAEGSVKKENSMRILWVGRLLKWKRVDTIIRAVCEYMKHARKDDSRPNIKLDVLGTGPEEAYLKKLARGCEAVVQFYPSVPISEVRRLMREHDVYVLASNGHEGWGAALNEALEEGMKVIGTYEAGSSATILPGSNLYHAGDWKRLAAMFRMSIPSVDSTEWTVRNAACIFKTKVLDDSSEN